MTSVEPDFLGLFARERNLVSLKAGEVLFRRGDDAHAMYVILSGEVRVGDGNADYGRIGAGSIVGEMALIDHAPRSATVTAVSDTSLAEIDEKRFIYLVERTPNFALNVMRILSQRLRRSNEMISV
ncbi:MAG TPA: Crp/Fnr family transcriptional regulator [Stellaceae bacterium]|nr:Crp/Fnr family transcriptional regulator [Stellaceae bacterium]